MRTTITGAVLALAVALAGCSDDVAMLEPPQFMGDDSWKGIDPKIISDALPVLTENFFDPDSTKLRRLSLGAPGKATMCGEVNAKNRMGAYVGYRPFAVLSAADDAPGTAMVIDLDPSKRENLDREVGLVLLCPAWEQFASQYVRDLVYVAKLPPEAIPASIRGFCRASEVMLDEVDECIATQVRESIAARRLIDSGSVTEEQYQTCMKSAWKAGGYSDLQDVHVCMGKFRMSNERVAAGRPPLD